MPATATAITIPVILIALILTVALMPTLAQDLPDFIHKCMEKHRNDPWSSDEIVQDLTEAIEGNGGSWMKFCPPSDVPDAEVDGSVPDIYYYLIFDPEKGYAVCVTCSVCGTCITAYQVSDPHRFIRKRLEEGFLPCDGRGQVPAWEDALNRKHG